MLHHHLLPRLLLHNRLSPCLTLPPCTAALYLHCVLPAPVLPVQVQATWRMMGTRLVALLPCLTLAVVFEATNTFDRVAQTINIVQSLVLPFGLIPAIQMTASEKVMVSA